MGSAVAIKWLCPRSCGPVRNTAVHVDVRAEMIFTSYEFFTHGKKLLVYQLVDWSGFAVPPVLLSSD